MDFKKVEVLPTSEIKIYKLSLENEFEKTKQEISEKISYLDVLDKEYLKAERELNKRNGKIY